MLKALLDANVASVRRRIAQGDCPTEPALSVETLEHMVSDLAAPSSGHAMAEGERGLPCETCQGNGEIVIDWDRYKHSQPGDTGEEGTADCPDCDGTGRVDATTPPTTNDAIPAGMGADNNPCRNCGMEYPHPMQTAANTPPDEMARIQMLADVELYLQSVRIFLTTREKMHPCGVDLHDELQARVTAAINEGKHNG